VGDPDAESSGHLDHPQAEHVPASFVERVVGVEPNAGRRARIRGTVCATLSSEAGRGHAISERGGDMTGFKVNPAALDAYAKVVGDPNAGGSSIDYKYV
jgi:D-serine deaminase-like pyridoxal phosphate-dependent protein